MNTPLNKKQIESLPYGYTQTSDGMNRSKRRELVKLMYKKLKSKNKNKVV